MGAVIVSLIALIVLIAFSVQVGPISLVFWVVFIGCIVWSVRKFGLRP